MGGDMNSCIRLALVEKLKIYTACPGSGCQLNVYTAAGKIIIIMKPHSYNVILWMPEHNQVLPIAYQASLYLCWTCLALSVSSKLNDWDQTQHDTRIIKRYSEMHMYQNKFNQCLNCSHNCVQYFLSERVRDKSYVTL